MYSQTSQRDRIFREGEVDVIGVIKPLRNLPKVKVR